MFWRAKHLRVDDPNRTVVVVAGRNSMRKNMPRAILAFKEFKKRVPNSVLYCHTQVEDGSNPYQRTDLTRTCSELGLRPGEDILFPQNYTAASGFPENTVNQLYNTGDLYLTTALGEGYGLIDQEMMACGVPVVAGNHTVRPELYGKYSERGFLYDCKELVWIDNCYSPDTEVLTENGWKFFKDLQSTDQLATLNRETEEIEYYKPHRLVKENYSGKMYHLSHSGNCRTDLLVTANHNLLVSKVKKGIANHWEFLKPEQVYGNRNLRFKKNARWASSIEPTTISIPGFDQEIKTELWMEFLGYFLSEGSTTVAEQSHYIVQLRQNAGPLLDKMVCLFKEMGFNPRLRGDKNGVLVTNKALYSFLKPLGKRHEKYIPREVLKYSSRLLMILFEAMMLGDGHNLYYRDIERDTVKTKGGSSYATSSVKLRDDFMELLLKIGFSGTYRLQTPKGTPWTIDNRKGTSNYDLWVVGVSYTHNTPSRRGYRRKTPENNGHYWTSGWKDRWIDYSGPVYCATVPNHTLYVRRNGCPIWSGNSGFRPTGHLDDIVNMMVECHEGRKTGITQTKIQKALEFAQAHTWHDIGLRWIQLFKELDEQPEQIPNSLQLVSVEEV
jgi:hypothetical protein